MRSVQSAYITTNRLCSVNSMQPCAGCVVLHTQLYQPLPKLCKPAGVHDAAQGCMRHMFRVGLLELRQMVGRTTRRPAATLLLRWS